MQASTSISSSSASPPAKDPWSPACLPHKKGLQQHAACEGIESDPAISSLLRPSLSIRINRSVVPITLPTVPHGRRSRSGAATRAAVQPGLERLPVGGGCRRPAPLGNGKQSREDLLVHPRRLAVEVPPEIGLQPQDVSCLVGGASPATGSKPSGAVRRFACNLIEIAVTVGLITTL